jgi:hypothetical protein
MLNAPHQDCVFFTCYRVESNTSNTLVTFKDHIPKDVVHELGDTRHTLDLYCGRYIRITSDYVHILLSKSQWAYFMDLAGSCISRQILKLFHLHDEILEWRNKFIESKSFCTPPEKDYRF